MTALSFEQIIGQEQAKRSILCQLVDPQIGGCLLIGPPGCGKTTLARSASDMLADGSFIDVPLGCSEERLLGGIDPIAAMENEQLRWRDGLLSQAHQGLCYVDEVNLLSDHLTDHLLDVAASGRLIVERDGHSLNTSCRFVLIGSMNPEEGSLRPQLADRFAHHIDLDGVPSRAERQRMLQLHMQVDHDDASDPSNLQQRISRARHAVATIATDSAVIDFISDRCDALALSGHRRSLAVWRTARALAALDGLEQVTLAVCEEAWALCARHDDPEQQQGAASPPSPPPTSPGDHTPSSHGGTGQHTAPNAAQDQRSSTEAAPQPQHPSGSRTVLAVNHLPHRQAASIPRPFLPPRLLDLAQSIWQRMVAGPSKQPIRWVWQSPSIPECWHVVDASRSTARHGSLAYAQSRITAFVKDAAWPRQHLVHLFAGSVHIRRRITSQDVGLLHAGLGTSPLAMTLERLAQGVRRRHKVGERRIEIHSDGLLTPEANESIAEAKQRCRKALRRLSTAATVIWYLPVLPPRLAAWAHTLLDGLPITVMQHQR